MSYQISLPIYEGSLNLLVDQVKENRIDPLAIPIASIIDQFLVYLRMVEAMSLEAAGDFMLDAATLIYIKSRSLLPKPPEEAFEEEPEARLARCLAEYRKVTEVVEELARQNILGRDVFCRAVTPHDGEPSEVREADLFLLARSFYDVMRSLGPEPLLELDREEIDLDERMEEVRRRLTEGGGVPFEALLVVPYSRLHVIVTLLALLELVRLQDVTLMQVEAMGPILISLRGDS